MGSGKPPLPPPSATPETKKPPLPAPNSKKKDVAGASQTSPSTPSPSGQMPGFVQSRRWDVNAAPSISPSTPQPVSNKPAQLPNFIYNQNLYTGSTPSMRPSQMQRPITEAKVTGDGKTYSWSPSETTPAPEPKTVTTYSGMDVYPVKPQPQPLAEAKRNWIIAEQENYANKVAFAQANPGVNVDLSQPNPIDRAKAFSDYYLLHNEPARYSYMNRKVDYWNQKVAENNNDDNVYFAQKARVEKDMYAVNLMFNATEAELKNKEIAFDKTYGAQLGQLDELETQYNQWPKNQDGTPVINSEQELENYNNIVASYQSIMYNEDFAQARQSLMKDSEDLQALYDSQKEIIKANPLFFMEEDKAKKSAAQTEAVLEKLGPMFQWKAKNLDNPATQAVVDFALGIAYIPKALGDGDDYGWTDALYEKAKTGTDLNISPYLPVEDSIVAKVVSAGTTMGLMIATGYAMGAGGVALGLPARASMMAGQAAAGTVATMEGYYRAGVEAGMTESEAESYSIVNGLVQGMLEMVNPEAVVAPRIFKDTSKAYIDVLVSGGTKKAARIESTKRLVKSVLGNVAAENTQELLQQVSEWGVNMKANQITGATLDVGENWGETLKETAIITTILSGITGGLMSGGVVVKENRLVSEATYIIGKEPLKYKERVASMLASGEITQEKAAEITAKIDEAQNVVSKIPSNISPEKAVQLIPKIQEKIRLEDELSKSDDSLKPAVEEQIAAVSEEIRQDAGIKTTEEKAVEDQEKLVQEKEIADLNMLSTMGVITPEQQTRLNELNAKAAMAPAEATGVETKTTTDATQERIIEESRKQQYQDVEEGGLPPEASRRDITEQGGKVQQEKVLSSQVAPAAEVITATPQALEEKRKQTEEKIKRKDLFIGVGEFSSELGGSDKPAIPISHREKNGIEFVEYAHPETGSVDVIVTGTSENDFVGFYRIYENGKPTNKWSSKFENQSRNKENFKTMLGGVQEMLPQGHEYTEKTSISTDGLRVWAQQLGKGYELQYDENGKLKTNLVAINGDAIVNELGVPVEKGQFENIKVKTKEDFEVVKKALLPYLEKLGLNESNVKWLTGTVKIDLPILKSTAQQKAKTTPQSQEKVSSKTTPVEEAAAAVQRSLSSAGINVRTLTEEEAVAEGYSDRTQGMFEDKKGQIVVVPSRIQEGWGTTVVWHEGAHPVLNIVRNTDKPTYDAMVRGLKNLAQNATGKNKAQLDDVVKFAEEYRAERGQEGVDDESIAEFTGRVGSGMIDIDSLPKSFKQKFVDFINSMATKLGLGTVMKDTDAQTLINKAKQISDVLKSGRDIAEVVGAENVKKFEAGEKLTGQERAIDVFEGILDTIGISVGTVNEKTGKRKVTNFDVAKALNEYYKKNFKKIKVGDFGKGALNIVSDYAADEVIFAISKFGNNSGKGWYTVDFEKALNTMKAFDKDIVSDPKIKDIATVVIAIASNSTDVYTNLGRVIYAVDTFKSTGKIPTDVGVGKGMSAIAKSIDTYNKLLDVFGNVNDLKNFMSVVRPISESKKALMDKVGASNWTQVKAMGIATDPEWNENESLPTSVILFGPKIGAFWSNLSGLGGTPTIDRWCIRTMYRYMGDMKAKALPSEINDFMKSNSLEGQSKGSVISLIQDHAKMFDAILVGRGEYAGQTKEQRNERLKPYRKGSQIWTKMTGVVNEIEDGLTEKIENKAEYARSFRSFTKKAFEEVQRKVKDRTGQELEISDIQAILWIFEKELFGAMGVKQRPESTYSASAQRLVNELNSGKFTIDQLKKGKITDAENVVDAEGSMGDIYGVPVNSFESGLANQSERIQEEAPTKKGQESRGKRMDVIADTYVQSGLTEDGNDYIFFHVSSADEKSIRKGIDSRKFYSTRTSKSEKGTQYGVASYYTKPTDGERMVGGDKYVVRVSKDKVYPMDIDPKGYKDQVEKTVPENTPFRAEVIKKKMADLAAKDGYQMAVGEWYYSRTGEKTEMPEFRADALVALKPTNESASDFVSNEESGMERIAHPEEAKYKYAAQYEALGEAAYDYLSEKGRYDDAYDIARDMYMYGKVPTEQEMKTLMKGMPKKISNMAPKTGQQSMGQRMEVNEDSIDTSIVTTDEDSSLISEIDSLRSEISFKKSRITKRRAAKMSKGEIDSIKAEIYDLNKKLDYANNKLRKQEGPKRGSDWAMSRINAAVDSGKISSKARDLAVDLIKTNPSIFDGIAVSFRKGSDIELSGLFNSISNIVTVFNNNNDVTLLHELLHYCEKFMPEEVKLGIKKEWESEIRKEIEKLSGNKSSDRYKYFSAILNGNSIEALNYINNANVSSVTAKDYKYTNASEWWAVNGSEILSDKYDKSLTWVGKAKLIMSQILDSIKRAFGFGTYIKVKQGISSLSKLSADSYSEKMIAQIDNGDYRIGQQSNGQRMNVAGVEYTELSIAAQETLRARRSKKSYFDDAVSKMPKSDFDKDEVERIIKEENFGIITGENPMGTPTVSSVNSKLNGKAVKWLESRGYEVAPVTGKYGQTENSFFVPGLTVADAVEFAKAFNQDSVVTNEGMVYQDGRMNPRTMNDSFNVDSSSPTEDFVSAIRTEDGNVMGFKIGIDLETKVDSSYVAQSAVDTKSTEYAKSSVDKAISERADAKVQDDADTLSAINTTAEEAKSSSIINGPTKISQLKDQVVKAVEDGLISDATAKKVVDDAIKSYDEKVAASKESIKEAIDKAKDVISKFLFNPEGQYVTNPETGEKIKISKSSIFDVEATVNFATDAIKKAVDKGVDLAVALGNFKSALSNHPTIKNNIANNVITEGEFEAMLDAEIAKLTQLYNNLNNKKTEKASKTLDRVMRSNFVSQDIKDSLESQGITYVPDTISASVSDAQAIVDYFDAEGALDILEENMANVTKSPDVMPHTRALILAEIFDKRLKVADDVANDPSSSDQAKKAAADKAANTAIAFSTINGQYAKSVSIASKRMKEIVGMSAKGLEYFVDAQVKMKSKNFVKSNRMQRKAKKAMVNAAKTGNASDSKKSIMDSLMPEYSKLDDKFKTAIDANLSNAINSNGQINKKDLENALVAYYSGMQMSEDLKKSILSHTAAIKDMEGKQKSFSKIIEEYKSALSGLDPGTPAYKAVVDKYEKMAEDAAEAVRDADFKARLEAEIMGRKMREGRDLWQSLASIMKLNMLTPQTIIVNIVGYLPAIALRGAAVTIATPIDWSITMAMKATRSITGNKTEVSRTTRVVRDAFGGIKYGFAYGAKEGFRKIVYGSTSEDVEKYNMKHSMNAFQAWRDLFSKKSPVELNNVENKISAFIEATFGMPADAMSRMLSIGDKIPFEISKASKLSSLANETYVKNKDGSQRKMNNAERLEFIFNPPAEAAQIANDFAEKMTYQQKNVLSDMVNKAQKNIANDVSGFIEGPLGRHISGFANLLIGTVIPFTKTPVNLLTETFMFTNPALGVVYSAGYAAKSVKEERAGNEFKASYYRGESIRYFSRATVAMGVAMVAANMIKNGLMTGDEDEMKFDAKSMQYENVRARSLNLSALFRMNTGDSNWAEFRKGDFMINYSKLGTLGLGLSAWADFYRDKDANQIDGGLNDIMSLEGLGGISLANIKAMVDQSFMTGIAGVIDAIRDDQGNKVKKFQTNTVVGLSKIFIPNTVSAVSKASMDFTKETRTEGKDTELSDMIMNRLRVDLGITGSADELPSKITLWGEPVKSSPAGTNPWVYYLFDPVQSYSPDTESVGFKIQQSYFATPKSMSNVRNKMIPSKPDQTISINNSNVMLTGSEYEQYQILVGKTRKSMVSSYVNSDLWNQSSLEQRAEVLDSLYSQAAKIARVQFIMNTPRLMDINMGVK